MIQRSLLLFFICCNIFQTVLAQKLYFRNYSLAEGLSQSQVYAICQDSIGYIWFGTKGGGLCRFDGINFKQYSVKNGLSNSFVNRILDDKKGNIWIGTESGISVYDYKNLRSLEFSKTLGSVLDFAFLDSSKVLIGASTGLWIYKQHKFFNLNSALGLGSLPVIKVLKYKNDEYWLGTTAGIYVLDIKEFKLKNIFKNIGDVTDIKIGNNDDLWISTYGRGIFRYQNQVFKNTTTKNGLSHNSIYSLFFDDGVLWAASSHGVTKLLLDKKGEISKIEYLTESQGLCNNVIRTIYKDNFNNIWFGSSGGGLSKLYSERFMFFPPQKNKFGDLVFAICEDNIGNILLSTSEGGISIYDNERFKLINSNQQFTSNKVKCILNDGLGNIWFGTTGDGLYVYDGSTFKNYSIKNGLSSKFINALALDKNGRLWLATASGGISVVDVRKKSISKVLPNLPKRINTVFVDSQNNIWCSTPSKGIFQIRNHQYLDSIKISNTFAKPQNVRCINTLIDGTIVFGSGGDGLWYFKGKNIEKLNLNSEEMSENIYSLYINEDNNLWIGSDKGIHQIMIFNDLNYKILRYFGKLSGFTSIEATHNSIYKDSHNNYWFGSIYGAFKYFPQKDKTKNVTPKVLIDGINLFFNPINSTKYYKDSCQEFQVPKHLILPFDQNSITFNLKSINLGEPESVKFSWKLDGFDEQWSPYSKNNLAVYSNLGPGTYFLNIKAQNELSLETVKPKVLKIEITPPYWMTLWFRFLILVLVVGAVLLIFNHRVALIKRRNNSRLFVLETEKRMLELQQKALQLQMNPHFLFNCLNSIKALIAEEKLTDSKLYINKFAKLMRAILEGSRENEVTLDSELEMLKTYVSLEKLSRNNQFDLSIMISDEIEPSNVLIPSMILQPFVENAILHGLSTLKKVGLIEIKVELPSPYLKVEITDNGTGRNKNSTNSLNLGIHQSLATEIINERLTTLSNHDKPLEIIDLKDEDGQADGTKVIIYFNYKSIC